MIKTRRMRWAGHAAPIGGRDASTVFWWGNLGERDHWRYPGVVEKIILRWIIRKLDVWVWTGLSWLGI
jgi:hypothetical protein